jgi:hypothetical protein
MAKAMSANSITTPSAESLAAAAKEVGKKGLPPVHLWNPPFCGDIDMHIARDGTWFYEGGPIRRPGLVRLFSTILRKEGDRFFLVTPVEKVGITVQDAPFVAVDFEIRGDDEGQSLIFETNVGDHVTADPAHPIRVARDPETGEPSPYVLVRDGLEALIDRKSFYRMVELGTSRNGWFGVCSGGAFFEIIPENELSGE